MRYGVLCDVSEEGITYSSRSGPRNARSFLLNFLAAAATLAQISNKRPPTRNDANNR